MMQKYTSSKCSEKERNEIRSLAYKNGKNMISFISYLLDKHLPITGIDLFDKNIIRNKTVGVRLTDELETRLQKNIVNLSTDFVPVRMFEIVLTCVNMECENK